MGIRLDPLAPRRVQVGDLWQLGEHRLLCGDSRDPESLARLMAGTRATLTVTSPPYNMGKNAVLAGNKIPLSSRYRGQTDDRTRAEYLELLCSVTDNVLEVSEVAIVNLQMLAGNKIALLEYLYTFREYLADIAIWNKGVAPPAMARNVMNSRFEFLIFLTREKRNGRTIRAIPTAAFRGTVDNVYTAPPQRSNPYVGLHAATFPLHLPRWLIETFDSRHGIILDPFLGTGTTLIAAERLGRKCYGLEIDPLYCEIVLSRWEEITHKEAIRCHNIS